MGAPWTDAVLQVDIGYYPAETDLDTVQKLVEQALRALPIEVFRLRLTNEE